MSRMLRGGLFMACIFWGGCTSVKPYQKTYINDAEMAASARTVEKADNSFQSYREGAAGANGGKTGGGCGCN